MTARRAPSAPAAPSAAEPGDALGLFSPATAAWFRGAFDAPTDAQIQAWPSIASGENTLVVAPTGSGKTLAAFLWAIDRTASTAPPPDRRQRCRTLYISPLKALAVDVERNLRSPLVGIRREAALLGLPEPDISVALRSGDTPSNERRKQSTHPPDILVTTPESLFLILTSAARDSLRGVETVIIDEVHAVAGTKRGAHLAVSLERLDALLPQPAQRIGLSATVRPIDAVASFLGGSRPVTIVNPPSHKAWDLQVVVPVEDLTDFTARAPHSGGTAEAPQPSGGDSVAAKSIWPHVEAQIVDLIHAHRSTIVFANSRRLAERLTARLNEIHHERLTGESLETGGAAAYAMAQAGSSGGAPQVLARAHHGSVSKEARALIEDDLKSGRLPAVVATSSLELGIDMGAVDLVIQVESPASVASGLQRIGRAGHHVGAVSNGVVFPKYRGDLVASTVVAERMLTGSIESLSIPSNPLDVLAQHVVAAVSIEDWKSDELLALVRRATSYASLPDSAYESVLDMLSGRYPSDEFAELRPRLVWDRMLGVLSGRPGAQRLAVTSGGTIPDRGLFGVFLVGEARSRVGELDEEMVYESRVGDVFSLGASSWRIEDITHDRVLVSPAPGQSGRLPFWHGDHQGRPYELGVATGAFLREMSAASPAARDDRLIAAGLDQRARTNLLAYLSDQRESTGRVPDDHTIVAERFRDELGDWRIVVHSPFGAQVHAPWALIVGARLQDEYGIDAQVMHADDGLVLRLPDTEDDTAVREAIEALVVEPEDIEAEVTRHIGGSALFAARFRECAARALLLPRRDPHRRSPLWQQRQRSAQLLSVAAQYGSFPIVLETVRECLQDVFDVPALIALMRDLRSRRVSMVDVETPVPSPFARSLMFGYVANYMYEGDSPLAERRAAALALDATLLAELLGQAELRELLDLPAVELVEAQLQRLADDRRVTSVEGLADLLRVLGPLSVDDAVRRGAKAQLCEELVATRRAIGVRVGGRDVVAAIEDAARLRDALGTALPVGIPDAFLEPVDDPLGDLVRRWARTHGPFHSADLAAHFGLGIAVVETALHRAATAGRVVAGEFRPGGVGPEWCDVGVLRRLRRASVAALRREVEPVPARTLGIFLPQWQHVRPAGGGPEHRQLRGPEGVLAVVDQLQGAAVPASAWESSVLAVRVEDYEPAYLDELTSSGEVIWTGRGRLPQGDGWVSLYLAENAPLLLPTAGPEALGEVPAVVADVLADGAGWFFRPLSDRVAGQLGRVVEDRDLVEVLWDLVWSSRVTNDTIAPLRSALRSGHTGVRRAGAPVLTRTRGRYSSLRAGRAALPSRSGPASVSGRWSAVPGVQPDPTLRAAAYAEVMLSRHGVVTRGATTAEGVVGGFASTYKVLSAFEDAGRVRRIYAIEGLGAAQFAGVGAVDRLRGVNPDANDSSPGTADRTFVLAATDPANPYGAALPWPPRPDHAASGHKPGRKAGAMVILVDGDLVLYVERGGRSLLTWTVDERPLRRATAALAEAVHAGLLGRLTIERTDGLSTHAAVAASGDGSVLTRCLAESGFRLTPKGLRLNR